MHHRRTVRIKGYDYSQSGYYFITICLQNHECLFGKIVWGQNFGGQDFDPKPQMMLNDAGKIANECWLNIPVHYPNVILREHIVMPNHMHGIIELTKNVGVENVGGHDVGGQNLDPLPQQHKYQKTIPRSIGAIVRGYKIGVTKWFRQNTKIHDPWQRDFYETIIPDNNSYQRIANYIINNPVKWIKGSKF